jgi:hypothetical protein
MVQEIGSAPSLLKELKDIKEKMKYAGIHRAVVTEVDIDDNDYGAIRVFIPDTMTDKDPSLNEADPSGYGIIAYPANNSLGGRNSLDMSKDSFYQGTVYVPPKGSWIYVFFEGFNPNLPRYIGAVDIGHAKLPPENRKVDYPHKVYTILKTRQGRTICVADSEDVQRVEITGKKRTLGGTSPAGNDTSTYSIDGNQTTILFDERDGMEKVLIRTHKGDFIHLDIDQQNLQVYLKNDVILKNDNDYYWQTTGKISIKADDDIYIESKKDIHIKSGKNMYQESVLHTNHKSGLNMNIDAGLDTNIKSARSSMTESSLNLSIRSPGPIGVDGEIISLNGAISAPAGSATPAVPAPTTDPEGSRNT